MSKIGDLYYYRDGSGSTTKKGKVKTYIPVPMTELIKKFKDKYGSDPVEILVRPDEIIDDLDDINIPVIQTIAVQPGHVMLMISNEIDRKPILFGGERCPLL